VSKSVLIDYSNGMFYREYYYEERGELILKGVMVNRHKYGYHEEYYRGDDIGYYLNDEKISDDNEKGHCYIWKKEEIL